MGSFLPDQKTAVAIDPCFKFSMVLHICGWRRSSGCTSERDVFNLAARPDDVPAKFASQFIRTLYVTPVSLAAERSILGIVSTDRCQRWCDSRLRLPSD